MNIIMEKSQSQKYLLELEIWFKEKFILYYNPTALQKIIGSLGLLIGICSSVVIFFLSYHFGLYIAQICAPQWADAISYYFGITAVIPLSFLAGRTSSYVLQRMITPLNLSELKIFDQRYQQKKNFFDVLIWGIAGLSAIPFFYLTHTYLFPIINYWVIPLDIAAILAPIFVNSWALSSASDNLIYLLYQLGYFLSKKPLKPYQLALLAIHKRLDFIQYIISRLRSNEIDRIFQKVANPHHQENIYHLFNLAALQNKRFKHQVPGCQVIFSYMGAIIGAISEYQYFGTGRDAALWLHIPIPAANIVGLASLICNSTLMGYTGKIVFEEIYAWIDRQVYKIQKAEEIYMDLSTPTHAIAKPLIEWTKFYFKKAFSDISNILILIIAISAATPNVYLTILQQKSAAWYNYLWLIIAFLGPFCTNFFAISRAIHQSTHRQKLHNTMIKMKNVLPHLKPKYLITLKNIAKHYTGFKIAVDNTTILIKENLQDL